MTRESEKSTEGREKRERERESGPLKRLDGAYRRDFNPCALFSAVQNQSLGQRGTRVA